MFGWIEFSPDYGIRIELTGNLSGALDGRSFKFKTPLASSPKLPLPEELPEFVDNLADRQIGVTGEMRLGTESATSPDNSPEESDTDLAAGDATKGKAGPTRLYLEWFSQNGRVIAELPEVQIEWVDEKSSTIGDSLTFDPSAGPFDAGFTEVHIDQDGHAHTENYPLDQDMHDDEDDDQQDDDPYGLFESDLDAKVAEALGTPEVDDDDDDDQDLELDLELFDADAGDNPGLFAGERQKRDWDEVIPGIDPDTKAMYEQWDEIFDGEKDEPISYLFDRPLKLPKSENVHSDAEAEPLVRAILAQLARLSVALDVCEHFTPKLTYQLLLQDILPSAKVHPNLSASDMVQHYSTSDYCTECDDEFAAEYDSIADDDSDDENAGSGQDKQPDED